MTHKPIPHPSFLDECVSIGFKNGEKRWRSRNGKRIYTWDGLHGEIEIFNNRGEHLGVADPITGCAIKPARPGRTISV
jgi:hypothetical protein